MLSSDNVTGIYLQMFTAAINHSTTDPLVLKPFFEKFEKQLMLFSEN